jgi:hypothetical protein
LSRVTDLDALGRLLQTLNIDHELFGEYLKPERSATLWSHTADRPARFALSMDCASLRQVSSAEPPALARTPTTSAEASRHCAGAKQCRPLGSTAMPGRAPTGGGKPLQ